MTRFSLLVIARSRSAGSVPEARSLSSHPNASGDRGSGGNLSQNSSQSLNDLDKMDNNNTGSVKTAFFVPDNSSDFPSKQRRYILKECTRIIKLPH